MLTAKIVSDVIVAFLCIVEQEALGGGKTIDLHLMTGGRCPRAHHIHNIPSVRIGIIADRNFVLHVLTNFQSYAKSLYHNSASGSTPFLHGKAYTNGSTLSWQRNPPSSGDCSPSCFLVFAFLLVTQELQPLSRETDGAVIDKNEPSG